MAEYHRSLPEVGALTLRLGGQMPTQAELAHYKPSVSWFLRPAGRWGIHGIGHMARVLVWQELLARLLISEGIALDHEALRWAAVTHDTQRATDGIDAAHGARAAQWVQQHLHSTLAAGTLETVAYLNRWHVPADSAAPQMTPELAVFKDADGLDRVRLGDLDPRYLRWAASKQFLLPLAPALLAASNAKERAGVEPFTAVLDAATDLGLLRAETAPSPPEEQQATPPAAPGPRQRKQKIYLRFGSWPEDERSRNFAISGKERGVSVYPARYDTVSESWVYDLSDGDYAPYTMSLAHALWRRPVYLVTGEEVGRGQDGEPLLRQVRIVGYGVSIYRLGQDGQYGQERHIVSVPKTAWQALHALRPAHYYVTVMVSTF